jgi:hypothetical protein
MSKEVSHYDLMRNHWNNKLKNNEDYFTHNLDLRNEIAKVLEDAGFHVPCCEMNSIFFEHNDKQYGFAIRNQPIHDFVNEVWSSFVFDKYDPQYSTVCDSPDCDQILHKNICIYIWEKESTGEELTVCESCHQDMSSWRTDGWVEQGDDDEIDDLLKEYLAKCDGNNVSPSDLQDYLKFEGHYPTHRECCYLLGDSEEDVNEYMLSMGRSKSDNEVHGDE